MLPVAIYLQAPEGIVSHLFYIIFHMELCPPDSMRTKMHNQNIITRPNADPNA